MARHSANNLLNSLKGKIWLATSALAFFICTFGIIAYLAVSFLTTETFLAVFIPFLFVSFTVMVFGWWLSNEVVSPIEKVSLLAKSLERSSSTSLPRTTGSSETDELLGTLQRSSQQMQNLVALMEKVAGGNLDVALTPLENSDRLSASFQKLLAKVSESIQAKQDLEELRTSVSNIVAETAPLKNGDFSVEISSRPNETKEISETFRFLVAHLNELIAQVKVSSHGAKESATQTHKNLGEIIGDTKKSLDKLNQAKLTLKQVPGNVQQIVEELSGSVESANQSLEKARAGTKNAHQNLKSISNLRRLIQDTVKIIGSLNERSREINKVAKSVGDLAHRTNMIALNASIQTSELDEKGMRYSILEEEVERLALRAENTNKQISSLDKSIIAEIGEAENSLQTTVSEISKLSKFAIETGDSLSDLERYVGQFLSLQKKLISISNENSTETDRAFQAFVESISVTENKLEKLQESEKSIHDATDMLETLRFAVMDFNLPEPVEKKPLVREDAEEEEDLNLPNTAVEKTSQIPSASMNEKPEIPETLLDEKLQIPEASMDEMPQMPKASISEIPGAEPLQPPKVEEIVASPKVKVEEENEIPSYPVEIEQPNILQTDEDEDPIELPLEQVILAEIYENESDEDLFPTDHMNNPDASQPFELNLPS